MEKLMSGLGSPILDYLRQHKDKFEAKRSWEPARYVSPPLFNVQHLCTACRARSNVSRCLERVIAVQMTHAYQQTKLLEYCSRPFVRERIYSPYNFLHVKLSQGNYKKASYIVEFYYLLKLWTSVYKGLIFQLLGHRASALDPKTRECKLPAR